MNVYRLAILLGASGTSYCLVLNMYSSLKMCHVYDNSATGWSCINLLLIPDTLVSDRSVYVRYFISKRLLFDLYFLMLIKRAQSGIIVMVCPVFNAITHYGVYGTTLKICVVASWILLFISCFLSDITIFPKRGLWLHCICFVYHYIRA